jgi:hypothetical protein
MLLASAVSHFKGKPNIVRALEGAWTKGAVYRWERVVPLAAARRLAEKSAGALPVDESLYDEKGNIRPDARAAA